MRKLDFFRLQAPAAVPAHIGASSLKKSNFLIISKVLRKGADQAKCNSLMIFVFLIQTNTNKHQLFKKCGY